MLAVNELNTYLDRVSSNLRVELKELITKYRANRSVQNRTEVEQLYLTSHQRIIRQQIKHLYHLYKTAQCDSTAVRRRVKDLK